MLLVSEKGALIEQDNDGLYEDIQRKYEARIYFIKNPLEVKHYKYVYEMQINDLGAMIGPKVKASLEKLITADKLPFEEAILLLDPTRQELYAFYNELHNRKIF